MDKCLHVVKTRFFDRVGCDGNVGDYMLTVMCWKNTCSTYFTGENFAHYKVKVIIFGTHQIP